MSDMADVSMVMVRGRVSVSPELKLLKFSLRYVGPGETDVSCIDST